MPNSLDGRVALIIGGSGGIGAATARLFTGAGARIVITHTTRSAPETILYARSLLPEAAQFTAIGIGRHVFTAAALSYLAGGHIRVGIEDGIYLSVGVLTPSNAAIVTKIRGIAEALGTGIATTAETRDMLGLPQRAA